MKIALYCQHVLGIGHFHRSLELCRALAEKHHTTLILGGPPVQVDQPDIEVFQIPGLEMDEEFQHLKPCQPGKSLEDVKRQRCRMLLDHFQHKQPDIFISELYPFGRKAFKFELDPLLSAIRSSAGRRCLCCCSVRDILVEKKEGRSKFEKRAVDTLNSVFDGVLVHADPAVITLDATFGMVKDIRIPVHYTGFVAKAKTTGSGEPIRLRLGLTRGDKLIIASIGGGNVGSELLQAVIQAFSLLDSAHLYLQIFTGPYCDNDSYRKLSRSCTSNIRVSRFTDRFPEWLEAADLSISMAGYNTCMNLLQAGVPALVYPYGQNREQRLRAEKLGQMAPMTALKEGDLAAETLARLITRQMVIGRRENTIRIDGAAETVRQLESWYQQRHSHD